MVLARDLSTPLNTTVVVKRAHKPPTIGGPVHDADLHLLNELRIADRIAEIGPHRNIATPIACYRDGAGVALVFEVRGWHLLANDRALRLRYPGLVVRR